MIDFGARFTFDGVQYLSVRRFFLSSTLAAESGWLSRSQLAKQKLEPRDDPALCVGTARSTLRPRDDEIILAYTPANRYLVTTKKFEADSRMLGCWDVFEAAKATNINAPPRSKLFGSKKTGRNKSQVELPSKHGNTEDEKQGVFKESKHNSYSLTTSSYDGEAIKVIALKPLQQKGLGKRKARTRLIRNNQKAAVSPSGMGMTIYFPEGFSFEKYPDLLPYKSSFLWFAHKLYERRFVNAEGKIFGRDEFVTLNSKFARNIDPNFRHMIKLVLKLGIIERDYYDTGSKSYGYRLCDPDLRRAKHVRVPLADSHLAKRIDQHRKEQVSTRTDRWLRSQLCLIGLSEIDEQFLEVAAKASALENGGSIQDKIDCYRYVLERISVSDHHWSSDDQGRCYTLITNLKRELRSLLRVDGEELVQIDIANSQLTFLALKMVGEGVECQNFLSCCEQGVLYETIAEKAKANRAAVKKAITQRALFSPNDSSYQQTKIKLTFDQLFPEVADYLWRSKNKKNGHSKLARDLQFAEADFIIGQVCGRLRREGRLAFVTPVHDSLLFLPRDSEYVKKVMAEEFQTLGLKPKLEVKAIGK